MFSQILEHNNNKKEEQITEEEQLPPPNKKELTEIKGKKNLNVKILNNELHHSFWGNVGRRKRVMSSYFSDSAFGSQSDTKKKFIDPRKDPEYNKKYSSPKFRRFLYQYNPQEDEAIKQQIQHQYDLSKMNISLFNENPNFSQTLKESNRTKLYNNTNKENEQQ